MPYVVGGYATPPPAAAIAEASVNRIRTYARVQGVAGVKAALAQGRPVVLGIVVYASFERVGKDGLVPLPALNEQMMGGHAILAVGYDDASGTVRLQNSWGAGFGDGGFLHMPYAYVADAHLCFEAWTMAA